MAAWMLAEFLGRAMHLRVLALRLLDHFTDDRLKLEPLQLRQWKFFPPAPYFSVGSRRSRFSSARIRSSAYCSSFLKLCDEFQIGWCGRNGRPTHNGRPIYQKPSGRMFLADPPGRFSVLTTLTTLPLTTNFPRPFIMSA
jgi:hypothetical protein